MINTYMVHNHHTKDKYEMRVEKKEEEYHTPKGKT